jgi:hypothetical protein
MSVQEHRQSVEEKTSTRKMHTTAIFYTTAAIFQVPQLAVVSSELTHVGQADGRWVW